MITQAQNPASQKRLYGKMVGIVVAAVTSGERLIVLFLCVPPISLMAQR